MMHERATCGCLLGPQFDQYFCKARIITLNALVFETVLVEEIIRLAIRFCAYALCGMLPVWI
jgi:hypothetical protein